MTRHLSAALFAASLGANLLLTPGLLRPGGGQSQYISAEAKQYLDAALDVIQEESIKRDTDWAEMRKRAYSVAGAAAKPSDTYGAIRAALGYVNDHHSGFFTPDQMKVMQKGQSKGFGLLASDGYLLQITPGGPADKAGLKQGMRITAVDGKSFADDREMNMLLFGSTPMADRKAPVTVVDADGKEMTVTLEAGVFDTYVPPMSKLIDKRYGYLRIPGFVGNADASKRFAGEIQDAIRDMDRPGLRGWIVDLRIDTGGNMWPMITGLGALIGDGKIGSFVSAKGADDWYYRDGEAGIGENGIVKIVSYKLKKPDLPIVVLIDRRTASSGEATAISFIGKRNVVVMGGESAGLSTANAFKPLSDGAIINLCVAADMDRTGKRYDAKISPDVEVKTDWSRFGAGDDPVIVAAANSIDERR